MKDTRYLTTGEAAELLGISRSTISRRFDAGVFRGKLNPITGERLISLRSVEKFIADHNLPIDSAAFSRYRILVVGADETHRDNLQAIAEHDKRLDLACMARGTDALVACAKENVDLLLMWSELPDTRPEHVIEALKGMPGAATLRIALCARAHIDGDAAQTLADACVILTESDDALRLKTLLCEQLGIPVSEEAARRTSEYARRWQRVAVDLPCDIRLAPLSTSGAVRRGQASVKNISGGGMLISNLRMIDGAIPGEPFRLLVRIDAPPLRDWEARCMLVRLTSNGVLSAGLQYEQISEEDRRRVTALTA